MDMRLGRWESTPGSPRSAAAWNITRACTAEHHARHDTVHMGQHHFPSPDVWEGKRAGATSKAPLSSTVLLQTGTEAAGISVSVSTAAA